ncbi:MAG TPA: potassium-transporting ATPase subunit KdpA, partial [Accumulibacter sp.]|nr:potassium-transporting ATPase subunit KdpA [Accumulibacter sp.]
MLALAELAGKEKQEAKYVEWLEKASAADTKAIEPRAGLIRYYLVKKENQKALALAIEASQANPDNLSALKLLADTRLTTGERASAIETWRSIVAKAPSSPEVYQSLAQAQMSDKQWPAARETLQKALQLKPDFLPALDALLKIEIEQKNPDAALRIARQMQSRQPASPLGFDREADILLSQQRYPAALASFEQALAKGAGTPGMIKLHRALLASGDKAAAEGRLADWLTKFPKDLTARAYAGDVYLQANDNRQAITQYEVLLQAYVPEQTVSVLTQVMALTVQNFLSAASGIAVAAAFVRGLARHSSATIGNAWVDIFRVTVGILLPLSLLLGIFLVSCGVVQTFEADLPLTTLEASRSDG